MAGHTLLITGGAGYVSSVLLQKYFSESENQPHAEKSTISSVTAINKQMPVKIRIETDDKNNPFEMDISNVKILDKAPTSNVDTSKLGIPVEYHQVDLCDNTSVNAAFEGADVVLHLASYGMSGREQLHQKTIWEVNVKGTKNVIGACLANNVKALVFTSTVNVVFGGQRIESGDESLPYFDSKQRTWDNYSNSKMEAERYILQANGSLTDDGLTVLRTCALRLPGIYGPNERRHIPRVVGIMRQGIYKITHGDNPVVEFMHSENVAKALMLSAGKLLDKSSPVAGEAYFVSDGAPINNFEFFRPLNDALGVPYPSVVLPMWLVFYVAFMIEIVYGIFHNLYDFQPLLCRAEVYKTGQTHYFRIDKARRELGYRPDFQNDMSEIAQYYKNLYHPDNQPVRIQSRCTRFLCDLFLVIIVTCLIMWCLPTAR